MWVGLEGGGGARLAAADNWRVPYVKNVPTPTSPTNCVDRDCISAYSGRLRPRTSQGTMLITIFRVSGFDNERSTSLPTAVPVRQVLPILPYD